MFLWSKEQRLNSFLKMILHKFLFVSVYLLLHNVIFIESESERLQHILMWTTTDLHPFSTWKNGQEIFLENKCPVTDCYVTSRRDFFGDDVTKFDAVVFNGRSLDAWSLTDLPEKRLPHQKYIFLNMESSDYYPLCNPIYDGFFNMTATYKLDSDIVYSYILIKNNAGEDVGPRINMTWIEHMSGVNQTLLNILEKKTTAAAWFVSNCRTRSRREDYAKELKAALKKYNLDLDIYGKCGDRTCPRSEKQKCHDMLKEKYYFYLSFENSFSEDYVTEKLLTALHHGLIPIVYGGANYSRFLPPGSYLDGRVLNPQELAARMAHIISTPAELQDFFRWRNYYTFHYPEGVCRLCAILNNRTVQETHKVYENFTGWWHPDYVKRCNGSSVSNVLNSLTLSLALIAIYWQVILFTTTI